MSQTEPTDADTWATRPMTAPPPLVRTPMTSTGVPAQLGPYRLVKELGSGGMGVVFLADDTQLGRQAAVKLMRPEMTVKLRLTVNEHRFRLCRLSAETLDFLA